MAGNYNASTQPKSPLDNFLKADPVPLDNFYSPALNWYRYKGKLYGLPFNAATTLFYYNKTLFDKPSSESLSSSP